MPLHRQTEMVGSSYSFCHVYISFLLVAMLLLLGPYSAYSSDQKVTVSLYYETLCPYCANFIVNSLVKVFEKGLISIVDLRLIPWGNGWIQSDGSLSCQHGPDECLLNAIEACAINVYPDVNRHFRFVYCIERLTLEGRHNEWGSCFGEAKMGSSPVDCYNKGNGYMLERKFAGETARLNPPRRFVPWVVVDGQALQEDFQNFVSYICRAYRGSQIPEACTSLPSTIDSFEENSENSVCYAGELNNSTSFRH
ncbi:gamma-interferon-responsive lysosomal thiol protein isoform X1 [Punica granatum]|uniref:Gamma-interferon-responsive lysosomal thiol protein isoform X1 n=2 Tax=Punica granatum TaxID=22663 RepID=A0A6P8CCH6_PUNGR|nr:gamma-interferon-responsive lysosomal thiol protein isoform X1 [Punica granatum]